jgi:hypothetical protein
MLVPMSREIVAKAIGINEIEQIFAVIEPMGISREAVVIPLRTEHPGRVRIIEGGKLEIVVDHDMEFPEWIKGLRGLIEAAMSREPG